jgi:UDP-glucose 4-epimerase
MMKILVTGAAGYIGSVVTEQLLANGHEVVAFDNLRHGFRAAVHPEARFVEGDLLDAPLLTRLLAAERPGAVVHLAAEAAIDNADPGRFFRVNVTGGINLLDAMVTAGVERLIFSSTAAVYGEPEAVPLTEEARKEPTNAYGESKLAFERILAWYRLAHGLRHISLRYFNACGATARYGQAGRAETHILPLLFETALGQRDRFQIYGTDYDTPDGTCIRDYVHVADIARAHLLGLERIDALGARAYNIGSGTGYSVCQVVEATRRATGRPIEAIPAPRRPGDPARLVASADRIRAELGWAPCSSDLDTIVSSAWAWRQHHPGGYEA